MGIILVVLLIIIIVSARHHHHHRMENTSYTGEQESFALKILNERYAKGEISDEEYKAKKANLK